MIAWTPYVYDTWRAACPLTSGHTACAEKGQSQDGGVSGREVIHLAVGRTSRTGSGCAFMHRLREPGRLYSLSVS